MIPTTLGERICRYRMAKGWSQEDLEEFSGVSKTQISRIERDVTIPTVMTITKIETALGLDPGTLFAEYSFELGQNEEEVILRIGAKLRHSEMSFDQLKRVVRIVDEIIGIAGK